MTPSFAVVGSVDMEGEHRFGVFHLTRHGEVSGHQMAYIMLLLQLGLTSLALQQANIADEWVQPDWTSLFTGDFQRL